MFMGEKFGRDSIWEGHLATELWSTKVQIDAVLDEQQMSLGDVMGFEVGQTLMLNASPDSIVDMRCGDIPLMKGKMGRTGGNVAVRLTQGVPEVLNSVFAEPESEEAAP